MSQSEKVMVIGKGGREHALVWKLAQSPRVDQVCVAPGNGGTAAMGHKARNVPIDEMDIRALARFARDEKISLTVVGPDDVLAAGIVDYFEANDLAIFGPTKDAMKIESSKATAKDLMEIVRIPTAAFRTFNTYGKASEYIQKRSLPMVIKASGLALGKGAYVCKTLGEAQDALRKIMIYQVHGKSGEWVVIEDFLSGPEISIHVLCDSNRTSVLFPPAQDHKPVFDNDLGENTGGMGTIAPVPWVSQKTMREIDTQIIRPILHKLADHGYPFTGLLYPGLKITPEGPKVLEFNGRFGDPETQSYMRLLKTDLFELLEACVQGRLTDIAVEWHQDFAATVVMVSGGYPGKYEKGFPITGLEAAKEIPGVEIFHAGTVCGNGTFKTAGGRVLGVSGVGNTLQKALDCAYEAVRLINFPHAHYRGDIGKNALARTLQ